MERISTLGLRVKSGESGNVNLSCVHSPTGSFWFQAGWGSVAGKECHISRLSPSKADKQGSQSPERTRVGWVRNQNGNRETFWRGHGLVTLNLLDHLPPN